jgi:hypothetical protein
MMMAPRRHFFEAIGIKSLKETDVNANIDESKRIYTHKESLVFD